MKFQKIDEYTIRCVLTEEDIKANGVELEDFLKDREKVHSFIEKIIAEAKEELGYEANGDTLAINVMLLPENGVAITLSSRQDESFKDIMDYMKDLIGEERSQIVEEAVKEKKPEKPSAIRIYRFENFMDLQEFCGNVTIDKPIKSQLFKNQEDNSFYLVIEKARLSVKAFESISNQALEYSKFISGSLNRLTYMEEHFELFIAKQAIPKLHKIANA